MPPRHPVLARTLRLQTRGAESVEQTWQRFVPSARLEYAEPRHIAFDWTSTDMAGFSAVEYELAATVSSAIAPENQLLACRVASPGAHVSMGRRALDAAHPWLCADTPAAARWAGKARVRAFIFDASYAQDIARTVAGDDRLQLRVADAAPRDAASARRWEQAYAYVSAALRDASGAPGGELITAELRRHALIATLTAFATSFAEAAEHSTQRGPAPASVRRAIAFIDAHAHEPISVEEIAIAARMSTRGLQYAFRRALALTPMEYLRRVRLAGAHADLRDAERPNIAEVARRWGFSHPSRFAQQYRRVYGRSPGDTVRLR